MNACIFEKANQIIRNCNTAYIGLIDENGFPMVSTISPVLHETIFEAFFVTGTRSNKFKCLQKSNKGSVCYHADGDNVTLVGEFEILSDQPVKSHFWQDGFIEFFPLGESDPAYCVLKFTTQRVVLWVEGESAEFTIDALLTVQSRCGNLCAACGDGPSLGCTGCIQTKGNPFWGECPVAKCCQDKGYNHCGECPDIPCDILRGFSCGDGEHCDKPPGARIAVCRAWANKK